MRKSDFEIFLLVVLVVLSAIVSFIIDYRILGTNSNSVDVMTIFFSSVTLLLMFHIYKRQSEISYRNQFESIFFKMLDKQKEIYHDINISDFFKKIRNEIETHFQTSGEYEFKEKEAYELFAYYFDYHISSKKECLHYFRHLYHIIKYVHMNKLISFSDKEKYITLIQAEMTDDELFVFLFNTVWWNSNFKKDDNTLDWLDKYSFFENLQSPGKWFDECKELLLPKTKWKHFTPKYIIDDIMLEDYYDKEQWFKTLDRLK